MGIGDDQLDYSDRREWRSVEEALYGFDPYEARLWQYVRPARLAGMENNSLLVLAVVVTAVCAVILTVHFVA